MAVLGLGGGLLEEVGHELESGVGGDGGGVVAGVEGGHVDAGGAEGVEGLVFEAGFEFVRGFFDEDDRVGGTGLEVQFTVDTPGEFDSGGGGVEGGDEGVQEGCFFGEAEGGFGDGEVAEDVGFGFEAGGVVFF